MKKLLMVLAAGLITLTLCVSCNNNEEPEPEPETPPVMVK